MSLLREDKYCPGVRRKCRWSTSLQYEQEIVRKDKSACQICLAHSGGSWTGEELAKQLAKLHELDPDLYFCACNRSKMPRNIYKQVKEPVIRLISSNVPRTHRRRESRRRELVHSTFKYLTITSWIIDCWDKRIKEDNLDIVHVELALSSLPETTRGLILNFSCGDLMSFYRHLCGVKTNSYHTMERPVFWYKDNAHMVYKRNQSCGIFANMYQHVIDSYHKPKLTRVQDTLKKHRQFMKRNRTMRSRYKDCNKILVLVDIMLKHDVIIIDC